jgi:hypothetical protein
VITDDKTILADLGHPHAEKMLERFDSQLDKYKVLFGACASLIYLPLAFVDLFERVSDRTFETELAYRNAEAPVADAIATIGDHDCALNRTVRCLSVSAEGNSRREFEVKPPELEFKSQGFWKAIAPGAVGSDKNGNQIIGKTWVSRIDSWSSESPKAFLVRRDGFEKTGPDPGIVYVLRTSSNGDDIYKVGLTRRTAEERGRELNTTGVALPFGVLANWRVGNCRKAEAEVHKRLAAYRLNPRREFFRADLRVIIQAVQDVIATPGIDFA